MATRTICRFISSRGSCSPGVSSRIIWWPGAVTMPMIRLRVVCGRGVTMAIFCWSRWLSRVDLPALGGPMIATTPERCAL